MGQVIGHIAGKFKIIGFQGDKKVVERLRDLGFYTGDPIEIVGRAWSRDPIFVEVRRAVVALRREEFECLQLESY